MGIAEQLHRALVVGFPHGVEDLVELDQMVIALDPHGAARAVVHQVVRHPVAHPFELNRRRVGPVNAAEAVDAAVLDKVSTRFECGAVAANDLGGPPADGVDVAPQQAVGLATLNGDAVARHAADGAAG